MTKNLQIGGGLVVVAVVLSAWLFPGAILFPVLMAGTAWGVLLGPLVAMLASCGLLILRGRATVWDWVWIGASAGVWGVASWWNLHAISAGYNIRVDFLALIPVMWAALVAPMVVLVNRMMSGS